MIFRSLAACATVAVLGGCALGIDGASSPRQTFEIDLPPQTVLDRAQAQAQQCLRGKDAYHVAREAGGNEQSGRVLVRAPFSNTDIARVQASAVSPNRSRVDIAMWGRSDWDAQAVTAMHDAITFNVVACKSYMPTPRAR